MYLSVKAVLFTKYLYCAKVLGIQASLIFAFMEHDLVRDNKRSRQLLRIIMYVKCYNRGVQSIFQILLVRKI